MTRKLTLIGFVALLVACLSAPAANAGAGTIGAFGAPVTLTDAGTAQAPQIAVNRRGDAVALWYAFDGEGSVVRASWRRAGGGWSPPVDVSTTAGARFVSHLDVALTARGTAIAVWTAATGPNVDIGVVQVATGSASGGWSAAADITRLPGSVGSVRLAATPRGDAVAVWGHSSFGEDVVQAATLAGGAGWSAPVDLSAPGAIALLPDVGIDDDGDATAVWAISTSDGRAVQTATHAAGGAWTAAQDLPGPNGPLSAPRVAVSGTGHAIAAWSRGFSSDGVVTATVRRAGGDWSAPRELGGAGSLSPRVAISDRARAVVVWEQTWPDGRATGVDAATRSADGSWSAPVELDERGSQIEVAMTPSGKAVAVWSAFDAIRSAATTSGATWSPARDVATAPAGHALEAPQVGISDKGQAVAAWWRWIPDPFAVPANVIQAAAAD